MSTAVGIKGKEIEKTIPEWQHLFPEGLPNPHPLIVTGSQIYILARPN